MFKKKLLVMGISLIATLSLAASDPFLDDPFGDDIFKEMMHMQQNMDRAFERMHSRMLQRSSRAISPVTSYRVEEPMQFTDVNGSYELHTNIPQNRENQIEIKAENGLLQLTAKIIKKSETKTDNTFSSSSSMQVYQHTIPLPKDADQNSIKTKYDNKKLVIVVSKSKKSSSKSK